jgi:hypothetical protein
VSLAGAGSADEGDVTLGVEKDAAGELADLPLITGEDEAARSFSMGNQLIARDWQCAQHSVTFSRQSAVGKFA